ncbi:hypothetical protein [Mycobacterium persicum]|nr:hypothetical protein [Mycobacterium persicum]KZS85535.1 hypothetical protein A4G31_07350 [Mycobacterium persicum]ORB89125.1 hypothetical protein B1T49_07555 [Mycobacterium persicum]ORB94493.1 hypothetical protein B1T44_08140 [Mycobacterium persicum]ORC06578.1 hypothetical protein B4U45_08020 [Mycobacterium persicum]VAZ78746.1 hypothetical protein LAUMK15_04532 [Mycobacterium persicum]
MTAPPGGPYGQDPNQYGQQPYWGGQPPGGGSYPYPPGGPYANPQGTDPYGAAPYQPQQYPQPGQQYPPGWAPGQYPPGPPPKPPGSKMPWLILAGVALVGVIALVIVLVVVLNHRDSSTTASSPGSSATTSAPTSPPNGSQQTATDCTPNVSGGDKPDDGTISAGKLSFPSSVAPGWAPFSDDQSPNLIEAVGVGQEVPGASQWMMQAEVAITNFVSSMDVGKQASKLMQCVASGPGYSQSQPTLGPTKTSSITVDGVKAARVDADITIADTSRHVKGDTVTIVAVDTKPVTIFMGATPIGDAGSAATISKVIAALKVSKS